MSKADHRDDRWTAGEIGGAVAHQILQRKCLVLIDNSYWTGYEADLLGVTMDLRLIDVEVKISRADLKADADKDKWWKREITGYQPYYGKDGSLRGRNAVYSREARPWPPKIWKHYYALPRSIWKPELAAALASANSGVLLFWRTSTGRVHIECERRAKPRADAQRLSPEQALDVARLASLRMWQAYDSEVTHAISEGLPIPGEAEVQP